VARAEHPLAARYPKSTLSGNLNMPICKNMVNLVLEMRKLTLIIIYFFAFYVTIATINSMFGNGDI